MEEMDEIVGKRAKETGLTKGEVVKRYLLEKVGEKPQEGGERVPSTIQEFREMLMAQSMREMMRPRKEGEATDTDRMFGRLLLMRMLPEEKGEAKETKSTMDRLLEYKAMKDMFKEGGEEKKEGKAEKSTMDKILEYKLLCDTFGGGKKVPSDVMKKLDELRAEFLGKRVENVETSVKTEMEHFRELLTKGKRDEAMEALASRITSLDSKLDAAQRAAAGGAPSRSTVKVMSEALKEQREFQEEMMKFAESQGMTRAEMMKGGKINWGKVMDRAFGLGEKVIESASKPRPQKREVIPVPEGAPEQAGAPPAPMPQAPPEAEQPPPERPNKLGLWVPRKEKPAEAPGEGAVEAKISPETVTTEAKGKETKVPPEEKPAEEKPKEGE